jgi:hypothetical protein
MKVAVLVHGFNVRDAGAGSIDKLAPFLKEAGLHVETDSADYGYFSLFMVRFRKHSAVARIAAAIEAADVIVCHSNGANYAHKALRLLERRDRRYTEVRLSPALNRRTGTTSNVDRCFVFHTKTDWAVRIASWIPFGHPWGRQGAHGYKGNDSRIENIDATDIIKRHSDWFKPNYIRWVAKEIIGLIQ